MVDLGGKGSEAVEANNRNPHGASSIDEQQQKKTCADCGTSKTPLWRSGPAGPKSLCNACGIRSRKKRRATLSVNKGSNDDRKKRKRSCSGSSNGDSLKQRLLALMNEVLTQRPPVERHWKKLGEEEQAAVLLMSLSA